MTSPWWILVDPGLAATRVAQSGENMPVPGKTSSATVAADVQAEWALFGKGAQQQDISFDVIHGDVGAPGQYTAGFIGSRDMVAKYRRFLLRNRISSMTNGFS
eukprot:s1160_g15.t1